MKHEFSRQILEKPADIKLPGSLFAGKRVFPCGQTRWRTLRT